MRCFWKWLACSLTSNWFIIFPCQIQNWKKQFQLDLFPFQGMLDFNHLPWNPEVITSSLVLWTILGPFMIWTWAVAFGSSNLGGCKAWSDNDAIFKPSGSSQWFDARRIEVQIDVLCYSYRLFAWTHHSQVVIEVAFLDPKHILIFGGGLNLYCLPSTGQTFARLRDEWLVCRIFVEKLPNKSHFRSTNSPDKESSCGATLGRLKSIELQDPGSWSILHRFASYPDRRFQAIIAWSGTQMVWS